MKHPSKHQKTQRGNPSQERKPAPPAVVQNLTDADLERVQGGVDKPGHVSKQEYFKITLTDVSIS